MVVQTAVQAREIGMFLPPTPLTANHRTFMNATSCLVLSYHNISLVALLFLFGLVLLNLRLSIVGHCPTFAT